MEAIQLSLFEFQTAESNSGFSPTMYLVRAWWDNVIHAVLKCICFLVTTGAIVVITATGVADDRQRAAIETIVQRRRRKAMEQGRKVYIKGMHVIDGQTIIIVKDTIK